MTIKEFLILRIKVFFILVTLILAASAMIGMMTNPQREIHYIELFDPIILAALCIIPTFVTYFKKEPTVKQLIVRLIIQLILIEAIVLTIITPPADGSAFSFYIILASSVIIIYIAAYALMWIQESFLSREFTKQLKELQADQ